MKGWPNDLDQLVAFFRKCGAGSAEAQSFSRDSYRLGEGGGGLADRLNDTLTHLHTPETLTRRTHTHAHTWVCVCVCVCVIYVAAAKNLDFFNLLSLWAAWPGWYAPHNSIMADGRSDVS